MTSLVVASASWLPRLNRFLHVFGIILVYSAHQGLAEPSCDREIISSKEKNGEFHSPYYPNPHPVDITCRYTFQGQGRERVQIIFTKLELNYPKDQNLSDCDDVDSVTVTVFINGFPRDIGIFCGDKKPPMLMSNDNRLEVTFVTRSSIQEAVGFHAQFNFITDFGIRTGERAMDVVCGFIFKSEKSSNGTFTSPNFPGYYPRNTECHYLFYGKETERIHITFPYFDVEGIPPRCSEETQSDYVEFSNFNVQLIDRKMIRHCGTKNLNSQNDIISDGNFFRVTFKSDDAYDATGFEAFYQFRQEYDPHPPRSKSSNRSRSPTLHTFQQKTLLSVSVFLAILYASHYRRFTLSLLHISAF
jgi:hypothetical protein